MRRAFRSEWVKLSRVGMLLGTGGAMAGFVALANFGMFRVATLQAQRFQSGGGGAPGGRPGGGGGQGGIGFLRMIENPGGWLVGVGAATPLLGIVALVVFASNIGGEYKNATLRFLLAGEPRRLRLLAGKALALSSLVVAAVAATFVIGLLSSFAFGAMFDVESSRWLTSEGLAIAGRRLVNVSLACLGWGALGGVLAIALRTSAAAIGIGVGYLLVGEAIISRAIVAPVLDTESAWFPGEVLRIFAAGGGPASSYVRAALVALVYVAAFAAGGTSLFSRRDVLT